MNYPIIFIPGLFGSLGDDIIPGTGEFSFGFAENVYRPFIQILNSMGYIEEKDLFISFYDWRKPVFESVNKYLLPDIERVKAKTGANKVILIGHSLGGLLARAYVNFFDPSNIESLIMIGAPNLGSVNAYSFWSGGKLPYSKVENNILYNGVKVGFILYYRLFHNITYIEAIQKLFPVARDLLPSNKYGNYLFWEKNGIKKSIPIEDMVATNPFLNLMETKAMNENNLINISGSGIYTNKEFLVDKKGRGKNKWADGKPIKPYKTLDGDGTVTTFSALADLGGNNIIIEGNHTGILYKCKDYLSSILERPMIWQVEERKIEKVYVILVENCQNINIKTSKDNLISSQSIDIMDNRVQAINLGSNSFWIMVSGDKDLEVQLDMAQISKVDPKVHMSIIQE